MINKWLLILFIQFTFASSNLICPREWSCTCPTNYSIWCTGNQSLLSTIGHTLQNKTESNTLLDITLDNATAIPDNFLENVSLQGLAVSSGQIQEINPNAFGKMASPLHILSLSNNQLSLVPTSALKTLPELERLDVSGNEIKILNRGSFENQKNLLYINLDRNGISIISPDTFDSLPRLKNLSLSFNDLRLHTITELHPLSTLEKLNLSKNKLAGYLEPNTFPEMRGLQFIDLNKNALHGIRMSALKGLMNLKSLNLQYNRMKIIEDYAFNHIKKLEKLNLSHNKIAVLFEYSFEDLNNLIYLNLYHNSLKTFTADWILPLTKLTELNLGHNGMTTIKPCTFQQTTSMRHLNLSENPFKCDDKLKDFALWLEYSNLSEVDKASAWCVFLYPEKKTNISLSMFIQETDLNLSSSQITTNCTSGLPIVTSVEFNQSSCGTLSIKINIVHKEHCDLKISLLKQNFLLHEITKNCSTSHHDFTKLDSGSYQACATVITNNVGLRKSKCTTNFSVKFGDCFTILKIILSILSTMIFITGAVIIVIVCWKIEMKECCQNGKQVRSLLTPSQEDNALL